MPTRPARFAVARLAGQAACRDVDPRVFDHTDIDGALPALAICLTCNVVPLCKSVVKPHASWYDGVAAGRLWRNGNPVPTPDPRQETLPL